MAQAWAYDARGNITGNGADTLTHDTANQPVSVTAPGLSEAHTYDGNLKRVKTVRNGQTTYWVYSALTGGLAHQDDVTANKQTDYLSGGGVTVRRQGNAYYFDHLDAQGSAMVQTDHYNGSVVWRELYTPFGEKTVDAPANRDDVGYTGHVQDDLSGLTYMQARYYDPVSGRFLSTDPMGYQDQFNLYAYVGNDPVNATDPTGEQMLTNDGRIRLTYSIGGSGTFATPNGGASGGVDVAFQVTFSLTNPMAPIILEKVAIQSSHGASDTASGGAIGASADIDAAEVGLSLGGISDREGGTLTTEADYGPLGGEVFTSAEKPSVDGSGFKVSIFGPGVGAAASVTETNTLIETPDMSSIFESEER